MDTCQHCEELTRVAALLPEYVKRLEKVETKIEDHDQSIRELYIAQGETKVYVKQILDKISGLEGQLFNYLRQVTSDATTERIEDRKADTEERVTTTVNYTELIKYVVGATVGIIAAGVINYMSR